MSRVLAAAALAAALLFAAPAARAERTYRVLIDSRPRGAAVYLDGDEEPAGETPYRVRLAAGTHQVVVERDGYATARREIEVRARRKLQKFRLVLEQRVTGILEIAVPDGDVAVGAAVAVDGERIGTAPGEFEVDVGPHVVEVIVDGSEPFEEWIEIVEGERVTVWPDIEPSDDGGDDELDGDPDDEEDDEEEDEQAQVRRAARPVGVLSSALVVVETGLELGGRHFGYSGVGPVENLRPYDADLVPLAHLGAELYPLAGLGVPILERIGLAARLGRSLALSSTTSTGLEVPTQWNQWELGARVRHGMDDVVLSAGVAYGRTAVLFDPPPDAPPELTSQVPEVDYRFTRIDAELRYQVGPLGYLGGASFLSVSSAGTSAARFRSSSHAGFGLRAGFSVRLMRNVEARATARYDRFASSFTSEAGDEFIAEGATDHIYGVLLGAAFVY